jgi:hypothetical protein
MPIFKKDKNSGVELQLLKDEVQRSHNDLSRVKIHLVKSKTDIVSLTRQLDQANDELRIAKKALREFQEQDSSEGDSDAVAEAMLQIRGQQLWIDATAVWHIFIEEPSKSNDVSDEKRNQGQYSLYLNNQFIVHGAREYLQEIASQIINAKERYRRIR